ncbi:SDR family NAD(P)-dependent oxidoreductase [Aureibaculum sp. 2210JD6-5]|uniref:SDR family NAD(P)-dependent oxidoreductase n=1 Tax=Aureibaculum sp. 2210JD6-5 TaxID=3103957 RepID=UPI002AADF5AF|nr:SDR family NAD(P)-dependent oxidoreductase [Aureibaculum sp. 2210JD6-5]MDY7395392.1 SDR family NAD(P)-dependent oxidoreductase [Aureibaculum sp. 2210JD6-5]
MVKKHIIITGASRGIGFEIAKILADQGHQVLALTRNISTLTDLQKDYKNISVLKVDISDENQLSMVSDFVNVKWQTINVLIHNAGALINKPFAETSNKEFLEVYKVNVFALAGLTKILLPFLKSGSHVVAISSMGGIQGSMKFPGLSAYSSSKGAVITLMELLAEEFKEQRIAFNTLALGAVQTEMLAAAFPDYKAPTTAKEMANYIADFALTGHRFYNAKVLQVSSSTP